MRREYRGEITIFLSLILSVMIMLILGLWESSLYYLQKNHVENNISIAGNSLLSEYNKTLQERYSLFVIDTSYIGVYADSSKLAAHAKNYITENLGNSNLGKRNISNNDIEITDIGYATDNDCEALYRQIMSITDIPGTENETDGVDYPSEDEQKYLVEQLLKSESLFNDFMDEWDYALEHSRLYNEDFYNPAECVRYKADTDVENLISVYCPLNSQFCFDTDEGKLFAKVKEKRIVNNLVSEETTENREKLAKYIGQKCTCVTKWKSDTIFSCEEEYILGDKNTEKSTIRSYLIGLIGLLAERNYKYLLSNTYMYSEVKEEAGEITDYTENEDLEVFVRTSMIAAWAYAEAYLQTRELLEGRRVDYFNPENTWSLPISDLENYTSYVGASESIGLNYEDILYFGLKWTDPDRIIRRFSQIAEKNVQMMDDSGFEMDRSVTSFSIEADMTLIGWKNTNIIRKYGYFD